MINGYEANHQTRVINVMADRNFLYYRRSANVNMQDLHNTEKLCMNVLSNDPRNVSALLLLATLYLRSGSLEKAMRYANLVIDRNPTIPEPYDLRGNIFRTAGNLKLAVDNYRYSVHVRSDYVSGYINLGGAYVANEQLQAAIESYSTVLRINPNLYCVRSDLGNVFKILGKLEEAKRCYLKAIETKPEFAVAWSNLGCIFSAQGDVWLAIHHFEK
ncbi:hypothetical protein A3Q56_07931, partial [Intoshia linei]